MKTILLVMISLLSASAFAWENTGIPIYQAPGLSNTSTMMPNAGIPNYQAPQVDIPQLQPYTTYQGPGNNQPSDYGNYSNPYSR